MLKVLPAGEDHREALRNASGLTMRIPNYGNVRNPLNGSLLNYWNMLESGFGFDFDEGLVAIISRHV